MVWFDENLKDSNDLTKSIFPFCLFFLCLWFTDRYVNVNMKCFNTTTETLVCYKATRHFVCLRGNKESMNDKKRRCLKQSGTWAPQQQQQHQVVHVQVEGLSASVFPSVCSLLWSSHVLSSGWICIQEEAELYWNTSHLVHVTNTDVIWVQN